MAPLGVGANAAMELGERLSYDGREYLYLGADPMSVPDRRAYLEDAETKERRVVAWTLLALGDGAADGRDRESVTSPLRDEVGQLRRLRS